MTDNTPLNDAASNTGGEANSNAGAPAADANAATDANANNSTSTDGQGTQADGSKPDANADAGKNPAEDAEAGKQETKDDGKDAAKDGKTEPRAPEKYELKVADGVALAPEVQTQFEALARELDLPQEHAQKLLDLAPDVSKMYASQLIATAKKTSEQWRENTKADKEIGGSGDQTILSQNLAFAAKARDSFASPELLKLLDPFDPEKNPNGTGFGNHPEVVRLFVRLGRSISEDNKLVSGDGAQSLQTAAQKLYSKTTPK